MVTFPAWVKPHAIGHFWTTVNQSRFSSKISLSSNGMEKKRQYFVTRQLINYSLGGEER